MWTTKDELEYVRRIGSFSASASVKDLSKPAMLRRYLQAAYWRADWGQVNREVVILRAEERLAELLGE